MTLLDTVAQVERETANGAFSQAGVEALQVYWDSTSLGVLKECPRKYYYRIVRGLVPAGGVLNDHLRFGILVHRAFELYDRFRAEGRDAATAELAVLRDAALATWDWDIGRPWDSDVPEKNRETLARTIVWYLAQFGETDPAETIILADGKPAVELHFTFDLGDGYRSRLTGETFHLCGHIDRLVRWRNRVWVTDRKAQPLTCLVLTENGWKSVGSLKVGDLIASFDGNFKAVKGLYSKGITPVYEIEFSDGTKTQCAEDHLWEVSPEGVTAFRTYDFKEVRRRFERGEKWHVPVCRPIKFEEKQYVLHPYILGCLLGDGYLNGNSVAISTMNTKLIEDIRILLPEGDTIRKSPAENLVWTITGKRHCKTLLALKDLNLWKTKSRTKFIPKEYLFGSMEQREALLKGLLDTDGSLDGHLQRYQTMSSYLADDISHLVRSLGGSVMHTTRSDGVHKLMIRLIEGTKLLPRRKYIKTITQIADAETACIEIDSSDGLYLTDDFIVTHNTTKNNITPAFFAQFSPDNQMSVYDLAGTMIYPEPCAGIIIDAIQVGVTFSRFQRGFVERTPGQVEEFLHDLHYYLSCAESFAEANYWPMNDKACGHVGWDEERGTLRFGCEFREICGGDPAVRETKLAALFERSTWDPTQVR